MNTNNQKSNSNQVSLTPELVRIAQRRSQCGVRLEDEVSRLMVEALIVEMDPELDILLDESAAMCQSDNLASALGVNDIVVNERRFDVRAIDDQDTVYLSRTLVGSQYLSYGTILVKLDNLTSGKVVGFIGAGSWMRAEEGKPAKEERVSLKPDLEEDFDFATTLQSYLKKPLIKLPSTSQLTDVVKDVTSLLNNAPDLISARRKQIFSYLCAHWDEATIAMVDSIKVSFNNSTIKPVLRGAAYWNNTVEMLTDKIDGKFNKLSRDDIKAHVLTMGETYGSEYRAPAFRKSLLEALSKAQLAGSQVSEQKVNNLVEKIISGTSPLEAVRQLVNNKTAVDLAYAIKRERQKVSGFVAATAEEIGMAFQKLALQPAYATHSSGDSGVESINEALALLEVSELAESVKSLDVEMAGL
ncbi:MAG: hypothetical protein IPP97_14610 [Candidatus Obscuribacter sp.]|nr:hypothetical protein [Candidatus Obscuribacter sp.]MBP6349848.1 hypothetical protein [Candidatus Obscuribacter sp.]MBP6594830.1 hypothetical protein [Candidatus Obscuribacter sp.]